MTRPAGFTHTEETKRKMREAWENRPPMSEKTKLKISIGSKGKIISEETRKRQSVAQKGHAVTQATRIKLRTILTGKKRSPAICKKFSDSHKGKCLSEEQRRKISEKMRGDNHPNWQGGLSFEPYCVKFNKEFKERVRTFFDHKCVECGTPENGVKLSIHHVNFRKDSCCAEDVIPLFVSLCRSCHGKTNRNRPYWEQHFTSMITERYEGKCYVTKGIENYG